MAARLRLTLACGDYDIVSALKERAVEADGIELALLTHMDAGTRHARMIRDRAFDVSELSLSSYLMAKARGADLTAIPVFLHRRFRHGFIFVNAASGVRRPADLVGRKVGLKSFQATANVWLRGILEHEYHVRQEQLRWVIEGDEVVEFTPPATIDWIPPTPGTGVEAMLLAGELDAMLDPEVIAAIAAGDTRVRRLFENYKELEIDYYRRTGIFPIMHLTAIKEEIVARHPWVGASLMAAFEHAKRLAWEKMRNPRVVPLAWFQSALEEQQRILGSDPWAYGLDEPNRRNIETLIRYAHTQGLIDRRFALAELFVADLQR